jgi:hypothetical protein
MHHAIARSMLRLVYCPVGFSYSPFGGYIMPQARPHCSITIRGSFDVKWADYVGEMMVDALVAEGQIQITTLLGRPIDLGAFLGAVHMLVDLGFPVTACEYRQAEPIDAAAGNSASNLHR